VRTEPEKTANEMSRQRLANAIILVERAAFILALIPKNSERVVTETSQNRNATGSVK